MSGRLIALYKHPGVRPVGVGETWWRIMAKCVLWVTEKESKASCETEQLAGGAKSGIEGWIHAMRLL